MTGLACKCSARRPIPPVQGAVKPKGVELKPGEKVVCEVVLMHLLNRFEELDPTHFREARCGLKITWKGVRAECMLIALSRPDPYLGGLLWKWVCGRSTSVSIEALPLRTCALHVMLSTAPTRPNLAGVRLLRARSPLLRHPPCGESDRPEAALQLLPAAAGWDGARDGARTTLPTDTEIPPTALDGLS